MRHRSAPAGPSAKGADDSSSRFFQTMPQVPHAVGNSAIVATLRSAGEKEIGEGLMRGVATSMGNLRISHVRSIFRLQEISYQRSGTRPRRPRIRAGIFAMAESRRQLSRRGGYENAAVVAADPGV